MIATPETLIYSQEVIMESLGILGLALAFVVGFGLGCVAYRYTLKRDPEKLEALAAKIKAAGK